MSVPTSVVIPTKDRAIPAARQRRLAKTLPNSTVYEFDGGHAVGGAERGRVQAGSAGGVRFRFGAAGFAA